MTYSEWETAVPDAIKKDIVWKMEAYRLSLFLGDLAWHDASKIMRDKRTQGLTTQFYPAVGSISANIAEGYSRTSTKDQARFFEYALGSARESRDWYFKCRFILGESIFEHRLKLLTSIMRLLLATIPRQRSQNSNLHEPPAEYAGNSPPSEEDSFQLEEVAPLPDV